MAMRREQRSCPFIALRCAGCLSTRSLLEPKPKRPQFVIWNVQPDPYNILVRLDMKKVERAMTRATAPAPNGSSASPARSTRCAQATVAGLKNRRYVRGRLLETESGRRDVMADSDVRMSSCATGSVRGTDAREENIKTGAQSPPHASIRPMTIDALTTQSALGRWRPGPVGRYKEPATSPGTTSRGG